MRLSAVALLSQLIFLNNLSTFHIVLFLQGNLRIGQIYFFHVVLGIDVWFQML